MIEVDTNKPQPPTKYPIFSFFENLVNYMECEMDGAKGKEKRNIFAKTWKKCQSIRAGSLLKSPSCPSLERLSKGKSSCPCRVAPEGCFSVYVGPEKQRFVIKAKRANHPLFKMVLEDAESEYGYNSEGPILIPCEVDLFYKVLAEMDSSSSRENIGPTFGFVYGSCSPFSPSRRLAKTDMSR